MNSFDLSRNFWNWAFDNPELISTNHAAIYFFAIEHCNRLGGKEKFGFPSLMTMEAIGIKKHQTYIKYFNDLVNYGFFKLVQKSKNQYSSNIISLINAMPKKGKALDKAFIKHGAKQTESMGQSNGQSKVHVDKQVNKETSKQETIKDTDSEKESGSYKIFVEMWFTFYETRTGLKPKFNAVSGRKIKSIITYLETLSKNKNFTAANLFEQVLKKWNTLEKWEQKNYMDLNVLDQKLPLIVNQLKNKTQINYELIREMEQKYGTGPKQ